MLQKINENNSMSSELVEAERLMKICNACRYCEGLCAVFPAMEMRRSFTEGDLNYLANLCHNCGACYHACQYAPPHEFAVNVPKTLSAVRNESYRSYIWPSVLKPLMDKNGLVISIVALLSVCLLVVAFSWLGGKRLMYSPVTGEGAFYKIMPHNVMALLFGSVFLYTIVAFVMGFRSFWRNIKAEQPVLSDKKSLLQALSDVMTLRYLDGEGAGCGNESERPDPRRRMFHHMTFYGFLLCFASTSVATLYHYVGGWQAPYDYFSVPVLLGTVGGIGISVGPIGLYYLRLRRAPELVSENNGMDTAFLLILAAVGISGLALMVLRETAMMGSLLALHLGLVLAFFLMMPYSKFVHGIYRAGALVRYAMEQRQKRSHSG